MIGIVREIKRYWRLQALVNIDVRYTETVHRGSKWSKVKHEVHEDIENVVVLDNVDAYPWFKTGISRESVWKKKKAFKGKLST